MILATYTKQPADVLDYDVEYADFLGGVDALSSVTHAVAPSGLTVSLVSIIDTRVKVWVSGGVNGMTYKVTLVATTADGRVKEADFKIRVKDY
jgi:hypothetical protein